MNQPHKEQEIGFFQRPQIGTLLTALSAFSFLAVCMTLPLLGRSGAAAPHAQQNKLTFLGVLLLSLALAVLALFSKLERRKVDGSPFPYLTGILTGLCLFLMVAALTGLLSI